MLINKKSVPVTVKYNEVSITTDPNEVLDVRNFKGVLQEHALAVEAHILKKNPGCFDQNANPQIAATSKEAEAQILSLQNNLNDANAKNNDLLEQLAELNTELQKVKSENDAYEEKIVGLKTQVSELKAKIKNLNHPDPK